jgi:hypothetical protein
MEATFLAFVALLIALPVWAAGLSENIRLLKESSDFRVRTQAALSLGTTASKRAVMPLCQALTDDNRTVRIAVATALSRLKKGGEDCLKNRQEHEKDAQVVSAITKAIAVLNGSDGPEPAIGPKTTYFVAVDKLAGPARLQGPVRAAFVRIGQTNPEVAFAPMGQTAAEATNILAKYKIAVGYQLAPRLSRPSYADGVLSVKLSVAILSYPGGALVGSYSKTVGMQGITSPDQESENELVVLVAEEAMKQFLHESLRKFVINGARPWTCCFSPGPTILLIERPVGPGAECHDRKPNPRGPSSEEHEKPAPR